VVRRQRDGTRVRLERLHEHPAGGVSTAATGELRQQLERPLLGTKVRECQAGVGVDDRRERDSGEVVPLGDHLRADEDGLVRGRELPEFRRERARLLDGVRVQANTRQLRQLRSQLALEPLRAGADPRQLGRCAGGARGRLGLGVGAVVAAQRPVAMQDERHVAVRATERDPARTAVQRRRDTAAVEEQDRLAAVLGDRAELREEGRRERIPGLAAQVDDAYRRQRGGQAPTELESLQGAPALGPRRRASEDGDRVFQRRTLRGDGARVVARVRFLLVRRVVLLVDADHAQTSHGREDGRTRADDDARLAAGDALPLISSLGLRQRRVENRNRFAESRHEPADCLRRQRNLGHEHDRSEAALERRGARLQVDLGLAASRGAVEEDVRCGSGVERRDDARDGFALRRAQLGGPGVGGERVTRRWTRTLAARLALQRRDEGERAAGRRAVVRGDPERELEQRFGERLDDPVDRRDVDSYGRRRDTHLRDDAAVPSAAEADLDDGSRLDVVRYLVCELARQGAGGHDRVYGCETAHGAQRMVRA
jgi:hypothetical protein